MPWPYRRTAPRRGLAATRKRLHTEWAQGPPGGHALTWDGTACGVIDCSRCGLGWDYGQPHLWKKGIATTCTGNTHAATLLRRTQTAQLLVLTEAAGRDNPHRMVLWHVGRVRCLRCGSRSQSGRPAPCSAPPCEAPTLPPRLADAATPAGESQPSLSAPLRVRLRALAANLLPD